MSKVTIKGWLARSYNNFLELYRDEPTLFKGQYASTGSISLESTQFPEVKKGKRQRATITIELESDE